MKQQLRRHAGALMATGALLVGAWPAAAAQAQSAGDQPEAVLAQNQGRGQGDGQDQPQVQPRGGRRGTPAPNSLRPGRPLDRRGGYQEPASARGYADGYTRGLADSRDHDRYDPVGHRDYRQGDQGYSRDYGSRDSYRTNYRAGFRQGYDEGYRAGPSRR